MRILVLLTLTAVCFAAPSISDKAVSQAMSGNIDGALATAATIESPLHRLAATTAIARVRGSAGDRAGMLQTFALAHGIIERTKDPKLKTRMLVGFALQHNRSGNKTQAVGALHEALSAAVDISSVRDRAKTILHVASKQAEIGDKQGQHDTLRIVVLVPMLQRERIAIARMQLEAGDKEGALLSLDRAGLHSNPSGDPRGERKLDEVIVVRALAGDFKGARSTAARNPDRLERFVRALIENNRMAEARIAINSLPADWLATKHKLQITIDLKTGAVDTARKRTRELNYWDAYSVLVPLAEHQLKKPDAVEAKATLAEIVRRVDDRVAKGYGTGESPIVIAARKANVERKMQMHYKHLAALHTQANDMAGVQWSLAGMLRTASTVEHLVELAQVQNDVGDKFGLAVSLKKAKDMANKAAPQAMFDALVNIAAIEAITDIAAATATADLAERLKARDAVLMRAAQESAKSKRMGPAQQLAAAIRDPSTRVCAYGAVSQFMTVHKQLAPAKRMHQLMLTTENGTGEQAVLWTIATELRIAELELENKNTEAFAEMAKAAAVRLDGFGPAGNAKKTIQAQYEMLSRLHASAGDAARAATFKQKAAAVR